MLPCRNRAAPSDPVLAPAAGSSTDRTRRCALSHHLCFSIPGEIRASPVVQYMHIPSRDQCNWLRERIETKDPIAYSAERKTHILDRLAWSEM